MRLQNQEREKEGAGEARSISHGKKEEKAGSDLASCNRKKKNKTEVHVP
jgi:hypothetical protein